MSTSLVRPKRLKLLVLASILSLSMLLAANAYADDDQVSALQQKVEQTAQEYNTCEENYKNLESQISESEARIQELQETLPAQRKQAAIAVRSLYKLHQGTPNLLTLILSTDDFMQFINIVTCLGSVQDKNTDAVISLVNAQNELEDSMATLQAQKQSAQSQLDAAKTAMNEAIAARQEAQRIADEKARQERLQAEAELKAAKAEADEELRKKGETIVEPEQNSSSSSDSSSSSTSDSGSDTSSDTTDTGSGSSDVSWSDGRSEFINKWAPKINRYLAGYPMSGMGKAFAESAWDNGVDPRLSPAIACIESGKGRAVPYGNSNNAWGWTARGGGFRTFSSWDEGCRAHNAYLARYYGPVMTPSGAKRYVGTAHWATWLNMVENEMRRIDRM